MGYNKQTFVDEYTILKAEHLDNIENGILANEQAISSKQDSLISGQTIKTINGQSLLGAGDISIVGSETTTTIKASNFEFYSQSASATFVDNGDGSMTITDTAATASKCYVAFAPIETKRFTMKPNMNGFNSANGSFLLLCYKNDTNLYGVRCEGTTIKMQRYNYSSWNGAAAITATLDTSFTCKNGDNLEFQWVKEILYFYCNGTLIHSFDMTSLMSDSGEYIGGIAALYFPTSAASKGEKPFLDMSILENAEDTAIIIDTELNVASANPIANSAVASKFNELSNALVDNRKKYSHFSIDDFYLAFKDLKDNQDTYKSIFDNSMFAWFKEFHDATGVTISCYCFYQDAASPSFTLDDVPTKFANEFKACKDWLKFGFHAEYQGVNTSSATYERGKEIYEKTIRALINITGSAECIDRIPRLHNFAGSLESCKGMQDAVCGVRGFLGAISNSDGSPRQNYYLEEEKNLYMHTHDYLFDGDTGLHFVRTQDGGMIYYTDRFCGNVEYENISKYVEFFTHENQITDGTKSSYKSAFNRLKATHKPVFWQDILS